MKKDVMQLLEQLVMAETGAALTTLPPVPGTGEEAWKLIWPLGFRFKGKTTQILEFGYRQEFELSADKALEDFVFSNDNWSELPIGVWAVLYERFVQFCTLMIAQHKSNSLTYLPPAQLNADAKIKFLVLFWLYRMTLPFPTGSASLFDTGKLFPAPTDELH